MTQQAKPELSDICKACGVCDGSSCAALQKGLDHKYELPKSFPQSYQGIRFTADAMDCALPISIDSHSGCSYSCIAEGMMILMADGTKKFIEEIKAGDVVLSYDENMKPSPSTIIRLSKQWKTNIMSVSVGSGGAIRMTEDHLVLTKDGYKMAGQLSTSDETYRVWTNKMSKEAINKSSERMKNNNPMKDPLISKKSSLVHKGKKRSQTSIERQKQTLAKKPPREYSQEERQRKSQRMLANNPMKDLAISKIVKEKNQRLWEQGLRKSPHLYKYGMGHYSSGQTDLYNILDLMGVKYEKEFCLRADEGCPNKHRVFLDAAIPEDKVAIEYDGFPYHSFKETQAKDKLRDAWLASKGWKVIRIIGDEVQNKQLVADRISGMVLTNNSGWQPVGSISKYDVIDNRGRNINHTRRQGWVYDIEASPNHNFVVGTIRGKGGIVVHNCCYCFSNNLMRSPDRNPSKVQQAIKNGTFYTQWNIKRLEAFLDRSLKDQQSLAMYPLLDQGLPIQWGALGDPFDDLELASGWAKKAVPLFIKYKQPVRISSKGGINLQRPEYLKLFESSPNQFWFAFSIICRDDKMIEDIDINAPNTTERLKAMKALTSMGCHASLRFRPFLFGVSDRDWDVLMTDSREAGAEAISFEFLFTNSAPMPKQKAMNRLLYRKMGNPNFEKEWNAISNPRESCRRGSRERKFEMTMKVVAKAKELGLRVGISDPHFKEYNDTGCCCGLPEDDKWFGGWSRRQMTNVVVELRRAYEAGKPRLVHYNDWRPEWAHKMQFVAMVALPGWHQHRIMRDVTFGSHMRRKWNDPKHPRGPWNYFQGILHPVGVDNITKDVVYEYRPWTLEGSRQFKGEVAL